MSDFIKKLVDFAEIYANSRGYEFTDEFRDFLRYLLEQSQFSFDDDSREQQVKVDLARRNVEFLIDSVIKKLPADQRYIDMHEWIHDVKSWICPLFPFC